MHEEIKPEPEIDVYSDLPLSKKIIEEMREGFISEEAKGLAILEGDVIKILNKIREYRRKIEDLYNK